MFCIKCGTQLVEVASFCHNCGTKLNLDIINSMLQSTPAPSSPVTQLPSKPDTSDSSDSCLTPGIEYFDNYKNHSQLSFYNNEIYYFDGCKVCVFDPDGEPIPSDVGIYSFETQKKTRLCHPK